MGVFFWCFLFSVDNSWILKPVDFAGEVFHSQKNGPTDFGRFRRPQLKNEALKPSCHKENISERESFQSLRSLPAQEAEGLEGLLNLPFLEDRTKRTGFWSLPKTEDSLLKREGTKRIRPLFNQITIRIFMWSQSWHPTHLNYTTRSVGNLRKKRAVSVCNFKFRLPCREWKSTKYE